MSGSFGMVNIIRRKEAIRIHLLLVCCTDLRGVRQDVGICVSWTDLSQGLKS